MSRSPRAGGADAALPARLPTPDMPAHDDPLMILGAGLAGLSLACALLDEGVRAPLLVIDRRREWRRDRTWCTWATQPSRFDDLVTHRWWSWQVIAGGRHAVAHARRHPYVRLQADDVYAHALDRLDRAPNVEMRTGVSVLDVGHDDVGRPRVTTSQGTLTGSGVFDGLGLGSPRLRGRTPARLELAQRFLGWEVELDAPAFDPGVATLMDFRPCPDGLRFVYVLPFSPTRALVEDTSIGGTPVSAGARRDALETELAALPGVAEWRITHEERGYVPMTTYPFALHADPGVHAIGVAAGAVRASSGYAFTRIQSHCRRLARAIATGAPLPGRLGPSRLDVLDAIFLEALTADPVGFPRVFHRLVEGVGADAFARFMTDVATLADERQVVAALPKRRFVGAALRAAAGAGGPLATRRRAAR